MKAEESSMLKSIKLKGVGDLKRTLTSDMKIQDLEFVLLAFSLELVLYFLTILPFLSFGMVLNILSHCMLEVCDLLFDFDFIEGYS